MANADDLRQSVRDRYRLAAESPADRFPYPVGRASAERLGYEADWLRWIPARTRKT